jgi:hypothetical protein
LTSVERDAALEALKAALTSWPRVELVRMERRWRGLNEVVEEGILVVVVGFGGNVWYYESEMLSSRKVVDEE